MENSNEGDQTLNIEVKVYGNNGEDSFVCGHCCKAFHQIQAFLQHKSLHATSDGKSVRYNCDLCKETFLECLPLQKHYVTLHNIKLDVDDVTNSVMKLCDGSDCNEIDMPSDQLTLVIPGEVHMKDIRLQSGINIDETGHTLSLKLPSVKLLCEESDSSDKNLVDCVKEYDEECYEIKSENQLTGNELNITENCMLDNSEIEKTVDDRDFFFLLSIKTMKDAGFEFGKATFLCIYCQFKTGLQGALTNHMCKKHGANLETEETPKYLTRVDKSELNEKIIRMSTYRSDYFIDFKRGRINNKGRPTTIPGKKRLRNIEKQDIPGTYHCNSCNRVFGRLRYLRRHCIVHKKERTYTCEVCGKGFKTKNYLRIHQKSHGSKIFKCKQCDFTSSVNTLIHTHRQLHSSGSVLCDICGFAYSDNSTLTKHKRVHDQNRPFACSFPECTWRFKSDVMRNAHIRAHTTEGKFKYCICGYGFRHKHHLQRHEVKTHNIQHVKAVYNQESKYFSKKNGVDLGLQDVNLVVADTGDIETTQYLNAQLVLATDEQGTPIVVDPSELATLNIAYQYQALFQQNSEVQIGCETAVEYVDAVEYTDSAAIN